jgi:hypothetical protein
MADQSTLGLKEFATDNSRPSQAMMLTASVLCRSSKKKAFVCLFLLLHFS